MISLYSLIVMTSKVGFSLFLNFWLRVNFGVPMTFKGWSIKSRHPRGGGGVQ